MVTRLGKADREKTDTGTSLGEAATGVAILLVLSVVAAWILIAQSRYDRKLFEVIAPVPTVSGSGTGSDDLGSFAPGAVRTFGAFERFDGKTLADKINGRADLYLSSGFVELRTQRFSLKGAPDVWMEVFDYRMESFRNAFSVYSRQKRDDGIPADVGELSYTAGTALFLVAGNHYLEFIPAEASEELSRGMLDFGRRFHAEYRPLGARIEELTLLPSVGRVVGSEALQVSDAFGFARLDQVVTALYDLEEDGLLAFVTVRRDDNEARDLARAWAGFLLENGGKEDSVPDGIPGGRLIGILGSFELIFHHGPVLAGIHEARTLEAALKLGGMLYDFIGEANP